MPLILAIEPDRHQSGRLRTLVDGLSIDLAIGGTTADALAALGDRIPDLVLTSARLTSLDDSALVARVRELDAAGAHAETLVVPDMCTADGDPSAFATAIVAALERGAAARAALAEAQAELEAAWAQPAAAGAALDVHPGMVIDDPEALFGEFAAIPIRAVAPRVDPAQHLLIDDPLKDGGHLDEAGHTDWLSPAPRVDPSAEEEWEEIALDAFDGASDPADDTERAVGTHDVEVADGGVDLDAFVDQLKTAPSTANAQPMIPVIDLSHLESVSIELPAPVPVAEEELRQEEYAAVTAEIRATFADADGSSNVAASLTDADGSGVEGTPISESPTAAPFDVAAPPPDGSGAHPSPHQTQESWRARLDLLPPPPVERQTATPPDAPTSTPEVVPAWGDLLSAIRRDIGTARTDETLAVAAPAQKAAAAAPLVFPSRSAAAARVLAAIESGAAERRRPDSPAEPRAESAAPLPEAALAELLRSVRSEALAAQRTTPSAPDASGISPVSVETAPPESSHPDVADSTVADLDLAALDGREPREERTTVAEGDAFASADAVAAVSADRSIPREDSEAEVRSNALMPSSPVDAPAVDASLPPPRSTSSRKRKPGRATVSAPETTDGPAAPPAETPETPEWGFLDAQADGFMSLLARLNAATADRSCPAHR